MDHDLVLGPVLFPDPGLVFVAVFALRRDQLEARREMREKRGKNEAYLGSDGDRAACDWGTCSRVLSIASCMAYSIYWSCSLYV